MGVLLLLRHGQASLGAADYDQLSDRGHQQARLAGERLARADIVINRFVSGTLTRQRQTLAQARSTVNGVVTCVEDSRLDEYDHDAVLAAHDVTASFASATDEESRRALQTALDDAIAHWIATPSEAGLRFESHPDFVGRVFAAIDDLAAQPGATVAVTSGGVIAVTCTRLLGLPSEEWPAVARVLANAGLTKIVSGRSGTNLVTFNDHAHLEHDRSLITYR